MNFPRRLNNKYLKQQHEIMVSFGYGLTGWSHRNGGHPRYDREGFARLELSSTPRSEKGARSRLLNELRKRHPEHPRWRSAKKARRHRRPSPIRAPRAIRHLTSVGGACESTAEPMPAPVASWSQFDPITDDRRAEWQRKADELARLNAQARCNQGRRAA